MPNVIDNEDLYNVIVLDGVTSPGKVTLSGHNRKINWQVKDGWSTEGSSFSFRNIPSIEFTASFYLVKDFAQGIDDYAAWDKFVPTIKSTIKGTTPKALRIYHPDLAENQIISVCQSEIGGRVYDGKGGCTIAVKFQEYRVPKKKSGAPVPATVKTDPNASLQAIVSQLTHQYQIAPGSFSIF